MTRTLTSIIAALAMTSSAALAEGDAAAGEKIFKKCTACHSIVGADGTAIVKGGKIGPNLFGVVGRAVASQEGFKYGDGIKELGAKGAIWDEAGIAAYVADPTAYLKDKAGDAGAKSLMAFKLPAGGADVAAYLATMK